ncbi:MAG: hypothetical protein ACOC2I_04885, partial [Halanaerobium sp.]
MAAPKRKRYNKKQRLAAAEKWIPTYKGKNLVKGYSNWFGVDKLCAIHELELLGQEIDPIYETQICKVEIVEQEDASQESNFEDPGDFEVESFNTWQDRDFYFIAGYTSGGVPYGITWEEYEREYKEDEDSIELEEDNDSSSYNWENDDFDLP